jgi:hypothetical protein
MFSNNSLFLSDNIYESKKIKLVPAFCVLPGNEFAINTFSMKFVVRLSYITFINTVNPVVSFLSEKVSSDFSNVVLQNLKSDVLPHLLLFIRKNSEF